MPSYRVMLGVPADLIWFVPAFAARRRSIGTRKNTRKLGCYRQALFGLAWFRDKAGIRRLGAGSACRRPPPTGLLGAPGPSPAARPHIAIGTCQNLNTECCRLMCKHCGR